MKIIQLIFLLFITSIVFSQSFTSSNPDYIKFVKLGEEALKSEKYDSCIGYYKDAFQIKQTSYLSTMRAAACGFSKGDQAYYDMQMNKAFELNWAGAKQVFDNYEEFDYLRSTPFEEKVVAMFEGAAEAEGIDIQLMEEFAEINRTDQLYRREMRSVSEEFGWDSPQMDSLWALQNPIDSANLSRICEIMDEHGYPGKSLVGPSYQGTAFLVIQHSDIDHQQKYLPLIKEAADKGEVRWSSVALLIDRVNLGIGKPQIYGSQIGTDKETNTYYVLELENPHKVDSLRTTVGLGPLQEYTSRWNFDWNPETHVEKIAAMKTKED